MVMAQGSCHGNQTNIENEWNGMIETIDRHRLRIIQGDMHADTVQRETPVVYITFSREKQYWIFLMSGPNESVMSGSGSSRKALTNSSNLNTRTHTHAETF